MARTGNGDNANVIALGNDTIGNDFNGAAFIAFHGWINPSAYATAAATNNRFFEAIINSGSVGLLLNINGVAGSNRFRVNVRSVSGDTLRTAQAGPQLNSFGTWYSVGCRIDFAGDNTEVYLAGTLENDAATAFTNTSWTQGDATNNDYIGGTDTTASNNDHFNGLMAEFATWAGTIPSESDFAMLARGVSPLLIAPTGLLHYWPLLGRHSPEPELISNRTGTITGTLAQADHPRILLPSWYTDGIIKYTPPAITIPKFMHQYRQRRV